MFFSLSSTTRIVGGSLIGQPLAYERGGVPGEPEGSPNESASERRGPVGETWFPPRERAESERRSSVTPETRIDDALVLDRRNPGLEDTCDRAGGGEAGEVGGVGVQHDRVEN